MRIVSLLASGTEIVCALGAGERLVGRSHECDNPAWVRSLPQCSEPAFDVFRSSREIDREVNRRLRAGEPLYTIHHDLIAQLAPDIVIAQQHCEVCAVTPADLTPAVRPKVVSLFASTVEEIFSSVRVIGEAVGLPARASELIQTERERLEDVRQRVAKHTRPTVVLLEWTDPIFAMGNWGPELIEIAGGNPLLGAPGEHSRPIPSEELRKADPDFLIVAPCGFDLQRSLAEQDVLEKLPWWEDLTAVRQGQVAFADGNLYFNRSGMTVARSAEIIAQILHGVDRGDQNSHSCWRWYTGPRVRA